MATVTITYAEVEQVATGRRTSPKIAWAHFGSKYVRGYGGMREVVFQLDGDSNVCRFTFVEGGHMVLERKKYVMVLQERWGRVHG